MNNGSFRLNLSASAFLPEQEPKPSIWQSRALALAIAALGFVAAIMICATPWN